MRFMNDFLIRFAARGGTVLQDGSHVHVVYAPGGAQARLVVE
jgi:hypothetical protein